MPHKKILLVEDEFFLIKNIKIKKIFLSKKSLDRFVKLQIESICPFSLEDILYGYVWQKTDKCLIIFIAYKQRICAKYCDYQDFSYIFPRFLCNLVDNRLLNIQHAKIAGDYIEFIDEFDEIRRFKITNNIIYRANLVPYANKSKLSYQILYTKYLEWGTYGCLLCLLFFLVLYGFLGVKRCQLARFSKLIDNETVAEIVTKADLLREVSRFCTHEDFCLSGLNIINIIRPDNVLFSDVQAYSVTRTLKIKGHADSVVAIMNYQKIINDLPAVKYVTVSHIRSKDREAFFNLEVQFE